MREKLFCREKLFLICETVLITAVVLFFVCPFSCKITEFGLQLISADYESPVLESYSVKSSDRLKLVFSKSVKLDKLILTPTNEVYEVNYDYADGKDGSCFAELVLKNDYSCGEEFFLSGCAEDFYGNTLTFSLPFIGFNSAPAFLTILEVHPKYQGEVKGNGIFKNEYVLFVVQKNGNLSGIKFFSANDGIEKTYTFPSVEVNSGEMIALHLRNKGEGCVNELGNDLSLSKAFYCKNNVRDLWVENENARLGDESDVLLLYEPKNNQIMDAVLYASGNADDWKKDSLREAALSAFEQGAWKSGFSTEDAFCSDGITATKSFVKTGKDNCRENWSVQPASLK